jgi:CO/xanthine dehydrogenase Mo-binding subunit
MKSFQSGGKSVPRKEGIPKVTGGAVYADDIHLENCVYGKTVRSTVRAARSLMVPASLHKNCRSALWVTNADLTPQAKRYVNYREYLRGWSEEAWFTLTVDYWNGCFPQFTVGDLTITR